jgi:hypothetical protein
MADRMQPVAAGTPWGLGVSCDDPGCATRFVGDFIVPEDSTRSVRLRIVLDHAEKKEGWRVIWRQPVADSLTYCPPCSAEVPSA